ncbi:MAG: CpsD/CapB family tyrosine-protein kinase [Desulfobacteria bacterium]|nr:CpsD/CapB family tyrosine-protein kinase [Deltaproteobacteria bacterium]
MKIPFLDLFTGNGADPGRERVDLLKVGEEDPIFLEQFKALRSKLEYRMDVLGWKVIGVTSTIAGEGKTLTCAKVAVSLARTKRKAVLLVDADIRKADLSKGFGTPVHPGLTEYLLGAAAFPDVVRKSAVPGLDTVSSGTSVPAPADLLAGDGFATFIEEARKRYHIVLLDTPPILPVADTMSMRERLDGLIFVYRAGFTPLAMFKQATEDIGEKKILGVVLNGVEPKSERYYGKYYGHYYTSMKAKEVRE